MTENMKKFLEAVSQNEELQEKLNGMSKEDILAAAKALGIDLTEADFAQNGEMDDDELDAVAGGGDCVCVVGGGGTADSNDKTCACVAGGWGERSGGKVRCKCFVGGSGYDT